MNKSDKIILSCIVFIVVAPLLNLQRAILWVLSFALILIYLNSKPKSDEHT